jgi:hypothetical protein
MATDTSTESMELETTQATEVEETAPRLLPNTFTGEAIDLDGPTESLAKDLLYLRELDTERKSLVRAVSDELLARMDKDAKWTLHFPGLDLTGDTPKRREYNSERVLKVLEELVTAGTINKEAAQKAIERKVSYTVKKSGVNAIKKLGGEVAKKLAGCEVPLPDASRRVAVKSKPTVNG